MTTTVTLPRQIVVRAAGKLDQSEAEQPDWGVYADPCWKGWPGIVLDWPDFGVPSDQAATIFEIRKAFARARRGQDVLIGCYGGVGRTETILACLAILAGVPVEFAVQYVRDRYHPGAVETQDQANWILDHFAQADAVIRETQRSQARLIEAHRDRIANTTRTALNKPTSSPVLAWAVPGVLAVTQRPLRAHPLFRERRCSYPAEVRPDILAWITALAKHGVPSVIVLTSNTELAHYYAAPTAPEGGLLALYRSRGLEVVHLPADDPAHDVRARDAFDAAVDEIAARVTEALRQIPLPAVIHCSAAIDRSPPVAARVAFLAEVGGLPYLRHPGDRPSPD